MARKWQKDITVAFGVPTIVEIPAGVGIVMCSHDFNTGGTATMSYSNYTTAEAIADSPAGQWVVSSISASVADTSATVNSQAVAIKLEAATTDQRFILVGETHG